ncbi:MAG TPA: flagellar basal-body rod protein FlgF [Stellaceae bacterium]|nr:flagellar basal-body rod protein FlgF [Stellaceae bacterium]
MDTSSSVALSGQVARQRQMDVLANNIANLSTVAFKGEEMVFAELVAGTNGQKVAYVEDAGTVRDWSQGPLTQTGNSLDVALQGSGFLEVETPSGVRYTRDGRLKLDATGQLVTLEGEPVLGDAQRPIALPSASGPITIGQDGTVSTPAGTVGHLTVVDFPDLQSLVAKTDGQYSTDQTPDPAPDTKVMQGMLEESNVQPVLEITRLMAAARAVGMAKTFQDGESERHKNAIDRLAKVV